MSMGNYSTLYRTVTSYGTGKLNRSAKFSTDFYFKKSSKIKELISVVMC